MLSVDRVVCQELTPIEFLSEVYFSSVDIVPSSKQNLNDIRIDIPKGSYQLIFQLLFWQLLRVQNVPDK